MIKRFSSHLLLLASCLGQGGSGLRWWCTHLRARYQHRALVQRALRPLAQRGPHLFMGN